MPCVMEDVTCNAGKRLQQGVVQIGTEGGDLRLHNLLVVSGLFWLAILAYHKGRL